MKMPEHLTKKLILITVFFTPLYLVKFAVFGIPTNVLELLIYATCAAWIFEKKYSSLKYYFQQNRWFFSASFLILLGLFISTIANQNYREGFGIIKGWFVDPMLLGIVIMTTAAAPEDIKKILRAIFWSGFSVSLISLVYVILGQLTYDSRLAAFYLSPNHLAMFLAPIIPIGLFSVFPTEKNYLSRLGISTHLILAALFCILTALYFTQSYAAIVSTLTGIIIVESIRKESWKKFFLPAFIFSSLLVLFAFSQLHTAKFQDAFNFSDRSSLASRIMIWKSASKILMDHPILGIGPGNFQNTYLDYQKYFPPYLEWAVPKPHNLYLAFWLESGIVGFFGFILLIFLCIKKIILILKQKIAGQFIPAVLLAVIFSALIHGLVDTPYWKNDLAAVFWVIIALGISVICVKD